MIFSSSKVFATQESALKFNLDIIKFMVAIPLQFHATQTLHPYVSSYQQIIQMLQTMLLTLDIPVELPLRMKVVKAFDHLP